MKPNEFLDESSAHCPKCKCNTVTTHDDKCKLCGTTKLDEEGGRWVYDNNGNAREISAREAAAQAAARIASMQKIKNQEKGSNEKNPFIDDDQLEEAKSGEIANHPWVCRRAKIKGTGEVGEVIRVCREHTFSQMVPFVTMVWLKLDSGETKEVRQNMVRIAKKTGIEEDDISDRWDKNFANGASHPMNDKDLKKKYDIYVSQCDKAGKPHISWGSWALNNAKKTGVEEGLGGSSQFNNGARVKLKPEYADDPNEVFIVSQCDPERNRCWIGDKQGRGWYASFSQLMPASKTRRVEEAHAMPPHNPPAIVRPASANATKHIKVPTAKKKQRFMDEPDDGILNTPTKKVRKEETELEEVKHFRTAYGWAGGRNERTGGTYKQKQPSEKKEYTVYCSQCGGEFKRSNKNGFSHCQHHEGLTNLDEDTSSSCIATAPGGKTGPAGPAGSLFGGPEKKVKETKKVIKRSSIGEGIQLAEYSTAAQRAEADKSYQEFIAKGGKPKQAPDVKYKEPAPGTGCAGTRVAGRGEAARGGGSGKPGLKSRTGKAAYNPIARPKIMGEDEQINEYKPKEIPRTLAGGKLNPNHPLNAQAIKDQQAAHADRKAGAAAERHRKSAKAAELRQRQAEKEKARKAGEKAKKALGSDRPNTPLEKKAQDAMWQVWNAIAPDMMSAIRGGGYDEDEDLLEDPFWIAEVCCDANHMQTFAHLSPEEENEILDTLDRKTLARLAANFGY